MTICHPDCKRPTPSQAHCASCHRTFGGVTGFDQHRSNGACLDLSAKGYEEIGGVWRRPMPVDVVALRAGAS